ncbi:hypothetical protein F4553_003434 [Allocatelliglobosispora scoriae]|uniref:Sensor domain-containing protein n=1 Tax=Allocatelliglobosispora scoriae TaxID=643052 RepID=A0A841BQS9_9ACTN|nr:hypothetical protein [Allocatelliglobosispora scoriae]MBB5870055.1 hypothetical protein [Allocatelliglobosispora scoriae]
MTPSRNKLVALMAAMVAVAALTTGCSDDAGHASAALPDLKAALPPATEHPEGSQVLATMPMYEAVARAMPGTGEPSGVVVMPRCVSYFAALGGLDKLDGWYQWGTRANGALFIMFVTRSPRPNAVELIRDRVAVCNKGYQTIQGWPPSATDKGEIVSSTLAFNERKVPDVANATAFGVTQLITFNDPKNGLVKFIRSAWQCPDAPCKSFDSMISKDNLFVWVHEGSTEEQADKLAKSLFDRAVALK